MTAKKRNISRKRSRPVEPKKSFLNIKIIGILVVIIIIIIFSAIYIFLGSDSNINNDKNGDKNPNAIIDTSMGIIKIELFKDKALFLISDECHLYIK